MKDMFGSIPDWLSALATISATIIAFKVLVYVVRTFGLQDKQIEMLREQVNLQKDQSILQEKMLNEQISLQKDQLTSQEKELQTTREHLIRQQFETIFYKMLDSVYTIGKDVQKIDSKDFFHQFIVKMKNNFEAFYQVESLGEVDYRIAYMIDVKNDIFSEQQRNAVFHSSPNSKRLAVDHKKIALKWVAEYPTEGLNLIIDTIYDFYFLHFNANLGHFFRYIIYTIQFVEEKIETDAEREKYIKLIQAQLSNNQLAVMFYNCLSHVSHDSENKPIAKELMIKYRLFKNLPPELLINPAHQDLYPNMDFKFPYQNLRNI